MMNCVGRLDLACWEASPEPERDPGIGAHVKECAACASLLAEITSARHELLGDDPETESLVAARVIAARISDRRRRSRWRWVLPLTLTPLAAGATLLLIVSQNVLSPSDSSTARPGTLRSKGGLVVEAFCKREDKIFPVKDGDDFFSGDRLRFAYTKDQPGILAVFGVDDGGAIFPYYRDDVLVGINLLREGLDLPEVSLVAILDADKEGFLRSEGSLIQTIGRAARNVNGKAILYADTVTGSMRRALDETARRRAKQLAWNEAHGVTPQTIRKAVKDIMEGLHGDGGEREQSRVRLTPEQAVKRIRRLEQEMLRLARNLEFERAAKLRDEIAALRRESLGGGLDRIAG